MGRFFGIEIPNQEAAKIDTLADAIQCISKLSQFTPTNTDLKKEVCEKLATAFLYLNFSSESLLSEDLIFAIPDEEQIENWQKLEGLTHLKLPLPQKSFFGKFITNNQHSKKITLDRYVDIVCAVNYKLLLGNRPVQNEYEVFVGLAGITIEKIGIDPFSIDLNKSFVNDYGLD